MKMSETKNKITRLLNEADAPMPVQKEIMLLLDSVETGKRYSNKRLVLNRPIDTTFATSKFPSKMPPMSIIDNKEIAE